MFIPCCGKEEDCEGDEEPGEGYLSREEWLHFCCDCDVEDLYSPELNKWDLGIVRLGMYGCGLLMWSPGWVCNWLLAASDLADDVMDMLRVDDNQKVGMNGASF